MLKPHFVVISKSQDLLVSLVLAVKAKLSYSLDLGVAKHLLQVIDLVVLNELEEA